MNTPQLFYVSDADSAADILETVPDIETWIAGRRGVRIKALDRTATTSFLLGSVTDSHEAQTANHMA